MSDISVHTLRAGHLFGARPTWLDAADVAGNSLLALVLLVLFSPLMTVVAVLVHRSSGSPVLFAHYRVSRTGRLFRCFKFRSMYANADAMLEQILRTDPVAKAEWTRDQKLEHDPRITPIGQFLRRYSLDELPQLFNVVRGEMRLVGPRPITVPELGRYGADRWHYLSIRPGMTGLWQVSGRNDTTYEERVALDRRYVEERSLRLDLSILFRTLLVVLLRRGAK